MALYKDHVDDLHDAQATIDFTRRINDVFDVLNARRPVEAIRFGGKQDKIQVVVNFNRASVCCTGYL